MPKIEDLEDDLALVAAVVQKAVRRLDVAVDDARLVGLREPEGSLRDERAAHRRREGPGAAHQLREVLAEEALHHHVGAAGDLVGAHVEDTHDVP